MILNDKTSSDENAFAIKWRIIQKNTLHYSKTETSLSLSSKYSLALSAGILTNKTPTNATHTFFVCFET